MVWTDKERELIAILDEFIASCIQNKKFSDSNYHHLVEQILSETQGEVNATRKYCQQILNSEEFEIEQETQDFIAGENFSFQESINSFEKPKKNSRQSNFFYTKKFKSFWTILFLLIANITIFFIAKKYPNPVKNVSNIANICPTDLRETARVGITNRNESLLEKAIAEFQELQTRQGGSIGFECEQLLWESQFIYAIDFLAARGQTKQAVTNLCAIPAEYYQNRELIPWFTRWSNTNSEFKQWFNQYKVDNDCLIANYLE